MQQRGSIYGWGIRYHTCHKKPLFFKREKLIFFSGENTLVSAWLARTNSMGSRKYFTNIFKNLLRDISSFGRANVHISYLVNSLIRALHD
jgi:hypothetical protein